MEIGSIDRRRRLVVQVHQTDVAHVRDRVQFEYVRVFHEFRRVTVRQPVQHLQVTYHVCVDRIRTDVVQPGQVGQRIDSDVADGQTGRRAVGRRRFVHGA